MLASRPISRSLTTAAGIVLGTLFPLGLAHAAPPSAADFQITYFTTDADGDRDRRMTANDLQNYLNQARCECGQQVYAEIILNPVGAMPDQVQVRTFIGTECDTALQVGSQFDRCALIFDGFTNEYSGAPPVTVTFDPIWVASGVQDPSVQELDSAQPAQDCAGQQGQGGIWICVEDGMQTDCQPGEFIIKGTQSQNAGMDDMTGMMSSGALEYDFLRPSVTATGFRATGGDGAVEVAWDQVATTDVNGFRVLCADAQGNPVPGKGFSPQASQENRGTYYVTASNLCPETAPTDGGEGGTDGAGETGTATSGSDTTTGAGGFGDPVPYGGLPTTGGTSGLPTTGTTGDATSGTDGTGGTPTTSGGTGLPPVDEPEIDSPIASLDWAYVCSDHVPANSSSVRVDGLQNGQEYQFIVVAYDRAGNPTIATDVLTATPQETTDLWERCQEQGDVCGDGGFCSCRTESSPGDQPGALFLWLGAVVGGLGVARRRRRVA